MHVYMYLHLHASVPTMHPHARVHDKSTQTAQAVTSTGLSPQIKCKRVFAKRSLALLLNGRLVKIPPKKNPNVPDADTSMTEQPPNTSCVSMCGYCSLAVHPALSFTYLSPSPKNVHVSTLDKAPPPPPPRPHTHKYSSQLFKNPLNFGQRPFFCSSWL